MDPLILGGVGVGAAFDFHAGRTRQAPRWIQRSGFEWLYRLCQAGDYAAATDLYRKMLPILRWDADPLFVQAIKLGQEEAGRYGGPVRLPRLALSDDVAAVVRAAARDALDAGY